MVDMLSGLHAPNREIWGHDLEAVRLMGARSVKLLAIEGCEHTPADLLTLRSHGVKDFTVRLRDTRNHQSGIYPSGYDYVSSVLPTAWAFYALGARRFQVCNEANQPGMWDRQGYGPWEYQFFIRVVVTLLRAALPPDVILVSPPLSYAPALWRLGGDNPTPYVLDDWLAAYHFTDGGRVPNLWQIFDEVGANVYWQSPRQMIDPSYGAAHEQLHRRSSGMPVCVLEYASSASRVYEADGDPVYTRAQVEEMRRVQYPEWLRDARALGYVTRAYVYISPGASQDWADFRLTQTEAAAIGAEETRGGGRHLGGGRGIV